MSAKPDGAAASLDYVRELPGYRANNPQYFDSEVVDHLVGIVLELGAELWVMRDRQAHLEELLAHKGVDVRAALESGRPSADTEQRLRAERQAMIRRIYGRLYSRYGGDRAKESAAL
jgi:hypothetical protein